MSSSTRSRSPPPTFRRCGPRACIRQKRCGTSSGCGFSAPASVMTPMRDPRPVGHPWTMYWDHMNGWGWTMMTVWSLVWVGFLGVIVWATVHWVRTGSADAAVESRSGRSPAELLDERLARGEIDVDEYERRRAALSHGTNRPPDDT